MLRLIRVIVLVILAFVGGILWGDLDRQSACRIENGDWRDNTCFLTE